jgi:integrase
MTGTSTHPATASPASPPADLAALVDAFLAHKRALGRKYVSEEHELRLLVRFADARGTTDLDQVTSGFLDDFLASRPRSRPRSFNHLLGVIDCLLEWAVSRQLLPASPLQTRRRRGSAARIPFLFDQTQARRLLAAAAELPDNTRAAGRGPTYHVIFALCYGLGLRGGEACGLRVGDIDRERQLLVVRGGKFGKTRLVPHGPHIGRLLNEHLAQRGSTGQVDDQAPLFTFDGRRRVHPGTATHVFHQVVSGLRLPVPDGVAAPTLHCLRHSFAVGALGRWYRDGQDPQAHLHQLSTFMGHVDPTSTAVYLTITPQLLDQANQRFEAFAAPAWTL